MMRSLLKLQAVVKAPCLQTEFLCPWDVTRFEAFSWIR